MIGKLKGVIDSIGMDWVIVDVGGVGYEVSCSSRTMASLGAIGADITLAIETYVREDQIRLFGFTTGNEREWFRVLQTVQGVGAKSALALLSTLSPADLTNAIALQDKAMVARAPGVGPKVAQRIVTELRDKVPALTAAGVALPDGTGASAIAVPEGANAADAVSALTNLGYAHAHASAAIASVVRQSDENTRTEELIRLGLKELVR